MKIKEIIRAKKGILAEIRKSHENNNIIKTRLTILKILFFDGKMYLQIKFLNKNNYCNYLIYNYLTLDI